MGWRRWPGNGKSVTLYSLLHYDQQMKSLFLLFVFTILVLPGKSQQNTTLAMDPIVQKAKEISFFTDRLDWEKINENYLELTHGGTTLEEITPGLGYLVICAGDNHSSFRSAKDDSFIAWWNEETDHPEEMNPTFIGNALNGKSAKFSYQLLKKDIGYLKLVGIDPEADLKEEADFIRNGIKDLSDQGADKWILDLRTHGGEHIPALLAGLAPLIGEGFIGGTVDAQGQLDREYTIKKGQLFDKGKRVCKMDKLPTISVDAKVAVLLSQYTMGSGEFVAVAFKGRENTTFLGNPSGGFTTINSHIPMNEDLIMAIAQYAFADRNGVVYEEYIGVDRLSKIVFYPMKKLQDPCIVDAVEWLEE